MNKPLLLLRIKYATLLGNFIGTLMGILWWDIPKELKTKLNKLISELKTKEND